MVEARACIRTTVKRKNAELSGLYSNTSTRPGYLIKFNKGKTYFWNTSESPVNTRHCLYVYNPCKFLAIIYYHNLLSLFDLVLTIIRLHLHLETHETHVNRKPALISNCISQLTLQRNILFPEICGSYRRITNQPTNQPTEQPTNYPGFHSQVSALNESVEGSVQKVLRSWDQRLDFEHVCEPHMPSWPLFVSKSFCVVILLSYHFIFLFAF